jgi:hypothetical protein
MTWRRLYQSNDVDSMEYFLGVGSSICFKKTHQMWGAPFVPQLTGWYWGLVRHPWSSRCIGRAGEVWGWGLTQRDLRLCFAPVMMMIQIIRPFRERMRTYQMTGLLHWEVTRVKLLRNSTPKPYPSDADETSWLSHDQAIYHYALVNCNQDWNNAVPLFSPGSQ